jgi:hypothetical protein
MERLINREDGVQFVTGKRLGSGLLAVVYAARSADGRQAAVKLPAPNLSPDQFKRFEEEHDLLVQLRQTLLDPTVPMAWWGKDDENGRQVLLLEMAPDNKLNDHLQQLDGWDREEVALKAAEQYAVLLQKLHTLSRDGGIGYTCADRKIGDLRWDKGKLVVLDWNAVRPQQNDGVQEDIHTFATLWYQLLTGRYAGSNLQLLNDAAWADGQVSIGTRAILLKAFSAQYTNAAELVRDIQNWLTDIRRNPESLYQLGKEALDKATAANNAAQTRLNALRQQEYSDTVDISTLALAEENNALRYLDAATHKGHVEAAAEREKALQLAQNQGERLVANAALAFEITRYELAEQALAWANRTLSQAEQLSTITAKLQLRVKRWQLLFHAGLIAIDEADISLRDVRNALANAVRQLEQADAQREPQIGDWSQAQRAIKDITDGMYRHYGNNPVTSLLNLFIVEAQCRTLFIQAEEDTALEEYERAINSLNQINQRLKIEVEDEPAQAYVTVLRAEGTFANLDGRIRQLHHKARTAIVTKKLISDLSGSLTIPATYVLQRLEEAHYFFANDLEALREIEEHNKLPAICLLAQLQHHQQTGQWNEAVRDLEELAPMAHEDEQVRETAVPFIAKMVEHIKEMENSQKDDLATLEMIHSLQKIQSNWQSETFVHHRF